MTPVAAGADPSAGTAIARPSRRRPSTNAQTRSGCDSRRTSLQKERPARSRLVIHTDRSASIQLHIRAGWKALQLNGRSDSRGRIARSAPYRWTVVQKLQESTSFSWPEMVKAQRGAEPAKMLARNRQNFQITRFVQKCLNSSGRCRKIEFLERNGSAGLLNGIA